MKKYSLILLLFISYVVFAGNNDSPVGLWQTIDDNSQQPASIVKLWLHDGLLYGKIVKIYVANGNKPSDLCIHCPGQLHNQPIQGIMFLWNLRQQSINVWSDGKIMDPKIGKLYACKITLSNDGNTLDVRGFIGIPLLGRTQEWRRIV